MLDEGGARRMAPRDLIGALTRARADARKALAVEQMRVREEEAAHPRHGADAEASGITLHHMT